MQQIWDISIHLMYPSLEKNNCNMNIDIDVIDGEGLNHGTF